MYIQYIMNITYNNALVLECLHKALYAALSTLNIKPLMSSGSACTFSSSSLCMKRWVSVFTLCCMILGEAVISLWGCVSE